MAAASLCRRRLQDGEGEDKEPNLGAPENHDNHPDQRRWSQASDSSDREQVDDDCPAFVTMQQAEASREAAKDAKRQIERIRRRKN